MIYEQGEIIIVPFPFSDLSSIKQRPVLVLSKTSDNKAADDIITCGITSNLKDSRYSIFVENRDIEHGIIPTKSRIKVDKLFTLNKGIIKKKIARLKKETFDLVKKNFLTFYRIFKEPKHF